MLFNFVLQVFRNSMKEAHYFVLRCSKTQCGCWLMLIGPPQFFSARPWSGFGLRHGDVSHRGHQTWRIDAHRGAMFEHREMPCHVPQIYMAIQRRNLMSDLRTLVCTARWWIFAPYRWSSDDNLLDMKIKIYNRRGAYIWCTSYPWGCWCSQWILRVICGHKREPGLGQLMLVTGTITEPWEPWQYVWLMSLWDTHQQSPESGSNGSWHLQESPVNLLGTWPGATVSLWAVGT